MTRRAKRRGSKAATRWFARKWRLNADLNRSVSSTFACCSIAIGHSTVFLILFFVFTIGRLPFCTHGWARISFPQSMQAHSKLHLRAQTGTRIEETARLCDEVDNAIRQEIPKSELVSIIDNIGIPYSGLNLSYTSTGVVGTSDADITVQLAEKHHPPDTYVQHLRPKLNAEFPGTIFYTLPVDMVTQILNFGLPPYRYPGDRQQSPGQS